MVAVAVLGTGALALAGAAPRTDDHVASVLVNSSCAAVAGLLTAWVLCWWKNRRVRPRAADFALVPSLRSPVAVFGWTAGPFMALMMIDTAYSALVHPAPQDTMRALSDAQGPQLITLAVLAICIAPVAEELVCRGVLYQALRARWRPAVAAPVSAVVFALPHQDDLKTMPMLITAGVVLCVVVERTGSLVPAIALHSVLNAPAIMAQDGLLGGALLAVMLAACAFLLTKSRRAVPEHASGEQPA
ncbi:CPBP family intramembrane glutamic endopeptidase [Actinomadura sp. NPDC047616]|uniref:CPBP family intramembrane glutamic endopeptidase n=1 Tax=Actinomadura sp. NPDC047616 TaxID=3155914 RepID=UPI003410D861